MWLKRSSILIIIAILFCNLYSQSWANPESAVYDAANDRYLVSNRGSGSIITVPRTNPSNLGLFVLGTNTGYTSMRGLTISGNTVWASCTAADNVTETLVGFDLATGNIISTLIITQGNFLNDVTASDDGSKVYISDNSNMYEVDVATNTYTVILQSGWLNGLFYDGANNRIIFTDDSPAVGSQISAIDLTTKVVTPLIANPGFWWLDGLTVDHLGNYYVSCWSTPNAIYRYDPNFTSSDLASTEHPNTTGTPHIGAADIFYDQVNNILAVPNMDGGNNGLGSFDLIPFSQLSTKDRNSFPEKISLHQNFPNPFNPNTTISYDISKESSVKLTVFDLLGSEIVQLVNQQEQPGSKVVQWDGRNKKGELVNGGVYLYKLEIGDYIETKKMVLLK